MEIHFYEVISIIAAPIVAIIGYFLRKAFTKLDQTMTKTEIRQLINDRTEPLVVQLKIIQRDIERTNQLLERICERLSSSQNQHNDR